MSTRRLKRVRRRVVARLRACGADLEAEIVGRMSRPELVVLARMEGPA